MWFFGIEILDTKTFSALTYLGEGSNAIIYSPPGF